MTVTTFYDMYSGGHKKTKWELVIIKLPEDEAIERFKQEFGIHPLEVTCECCGGNFSISEYETLEDARKAYDVDRKDIYEV